MGPAASSSAASKDWGAISGFLTDFVVFDSVAIRPTSRYMRHGLLTTVPSSLFSSLLDSNIWKFAEVKNWKEG